MLENKARRDGRRHDQLREVQIVPEAVRYAEGSVRIQAGHTVIMCTASVDENLPRWLQNTGRGWVTAEYGMLPRSTHTRMQRSKVTTGGRAQEISRLISRSLRSTVDMEALGPRQMIVDCDVLQADGGTRTYAVTGGYVALALALHFLHKQNRFDKFPLVGAVAAVSVGLQDKAPLLDLNYDEDANIHTDMNFVMNQKHEFVEVQGTAEKASFSVPELQQMLELANAGCGQLLKLQQEVIQKATQ